MLILLHHVFILGIIMVTINTVLGYNNYKYN